MIPYRQCERCGGDVFKEEPWAKLCFSCWEKEQRKRERKERKLQKEREKAQAQGGMGVPFVERVSQLVQENCELHRENVRLNNAVASLTLELSRASTQAAIPSGMASKLRLLCHPDRHHGTPREDAATEASQWLNSLLSGGGR